MVQPKKLLDKISQRALLYEISRSFSELVELERLIPCVIAKTKEILRAESSAILLLDPQRQELYFPWVADVSPQVAKRMMAARFPVSRGIAGWVVREGQPLLVAEVSQDPRWYAEIDKHSGQTTRALLSAPLRTHRGTIGVISLRNKLDGDFTPDDLDFLVALSGSIAMAIENALLCARLQQPKSGGVRIEGLVDD